MQLPGVGTFRGATQYAPTHRDQSSLRDRVAFTAIPAVGAIICAVLLLSLQPGLLILTSVVIALVGFSMTIRDRRAPADTVILVGKSPMAAVIASSIEESTRNGSVTVVRAEHLGEAAALARKHRCDEVVLVGESVAAPTVLTDIRGNSATLIPGTEKLEQLLRRIPLEFANEDRWLTRLNGIRPLDPFYAFTKRAIDVIVALGICLVMLPVIPLVTLAIKMDSRGPIFYSQQRVGLNGRTFRIYKFRTMRQDAEENGAVWASQWDPRITRSGLFMRKTRLDEIPQIWNLLRGEMALVGPRPERPEFTATLAEQIPAYDLRHTVKPGLTGWAQVCYRYTSSIRDTRSKVEYDLYYVKHCSLLMDLAIMVRTVKVVLAMKGQ
jgi:exopolysaccharide biosynthesis polyprenyl glycosylphosphotransferase